VADVLDPRALVFLQVLLGIVFVAAGIAKLEERYALLRLLRDTLRLPHALAKITSRTLPWFELALGVALLLGVAARVVTMLAFTLLVVFTLGLATARLRGHRELDCGCFGRSNQSDTTTVLIARNLLFLSPAVVLLWSDAASATLSERLILALVAAGIFSLPALVRGLRQVARMRRDIVEYTERLLSGK